MHWFTWFVIIILGASSLLLVLSIIRYNRKDNEERHNRIEPTIGDIDSVDVGEDPKL